MSTTRTLRTLRTSFLIAAATALLAAAPAQSQEGDRLRVRVVPRYTTPKPGNMRVIAWVEPDARNRRITVEIDSPTVFRSSERQLHGEDDARRHAVVFTGLPEGQYEVRVRLRGVNTDITLTRPFMVADDLP
jgi:hypothetical protein